VRSFTKIDKIDKKRTPDLGGIAPEIKRPNLVRPWVKESAMQRQKRRGHPGYPERIGLWPVRRVLQPFSARNP
jgi:hypothetical protein